MADAYSIVNDITNFCFWLLQKPYTEAFARPKAKFLVSLTIEVMEDLILHRPLFDMVHSRVQTAARGAVRQWHRISAYRRGA